MITNHTIADLVLRPPGVGVLGPPPTRTRLQGAGRRDGQARTATSARRASSSTTRPGRPRTGATTPPAASASRSRSTVARPTTRWATATTRHSTRSTRRWSRSGLADPQADHENDPGPDAGFDGQGNREAYLHRRPEHARRAAAQRARGQRSRRGQAAPEQDVQDRDVPAATRRAADPVRRQAGDRLRHRVGRPRSLARQPLDAATRRQGKRACQTRASRARPRRRPAASPAPRRPRTTRTTALRFPRVNRTRTTRCRTTTTRSRSRRPATTPPWTFASRGPAWGATGTSSSTTTSRRRQVPGRRARGQHESDRAEQRRGGSASEQPRRLPGKKYVLRVNNFAATAADNYEVEITYSAPPPFKPAQVESYTLTCEVGGRVRSTPSRSRSTAAKPGSSTCAPARAQRVRHLRCAVPVRRGRSLALPLSTASGGRAGAT